MKALENRERTRTLSPLDIIVFDGRTIEFNPTYLCVYPFNQTPWRKMENHVPLPLLSYYCNLVGNPLGLKSASTYSSQSILVFYKVRIEHKRDGIGNSVIQRFLLKITSYSKSLVLDPGSTQATMTPH